MSKSNPQIVLDSFALSKSFQLGDAKPNKLIPNAFTKSQNLFLKTWREQSVQNGDWGTTWNFVTPESLNVVSSHFLEIDLPAIGGGSYKSNPGMYCIDEIKLLSNGSEVYTLDFKMYMREFLSSLTNEEYGQFTSTYLGGHAESGAGRKRRGGLGRKETKCGGKRTSTIRGNSSLLRLLLFSNSVRPQLSSAASQH